MVSDERRNERGKGKKEFQERFRKDEQRQKDEGHHWGKMVQSNPKIIKESMEEGRSGKAESSTDKGDKEDDLTRTWSRDPMLAWSSSGVRGFFSHRSLTKGPDLE